MPKFFVTNKSIKDNEITIIGEDVNHIKNVLRKKIGDKIDICNSDTRENYFCEIIQIDMQNIKCNIIEKIETNSESQIQVSILQGLPKADKMELVIQKAVELGVYDITPVEMKRCVVKLKENEKNKKIQRWQKIAEVAAKQSERNIIPKINNIISIKNICNLYSKYDIVLVAYEKEKQNTLKNELYKLKGIPNLKIAILIGPEGGIDETEIEELQLLNNCKVVTLGNRILRTETVALNILSIIMYEFGN